MNWFTRNYIQHRSKEQKEKIVAKLDNACEHVEADSSLLFCISSENDSFGSESYGMCEQCLHALLAEEGEEDVVCHDCHQTFKQKDTISWRWYDFYAPQGDEPLIICKTCKTQEKHKARVYKDDQDYNDEFERSN